VNLSGALLARDKVDRYRSVGAFGKPAYQSHVQLRAMLLARRKPELANYFARPVHDAELGELQWRAELPGVARRIHELSPDEMARGSEAMARIRAELLAFIAELRRGSAQGGGTAFASLFEQAMKVPAVGDFVHFVGTQPVIAFWGFEDQAGASRDPAARLPAAPAIEPATEAAAVPGVVAPLYEAPATSARVPRSRRRWAWWLLLPLLLAALWLALGRGCDEPAAPALDRKAGQALTIPPGALERGDLSFLDGDWQLGADRLTEYKNHPGNIVGSGRNVLHFDRDGKGTASMVERQRHAANQSSGSAFPDCSGSLRAHTDGKTLFFEQGECQVPGRPGMGFDGSRHECVRAPEGRTICYNLNDDGHRWEAPLRRLQ
jgi:hypothetical protein